MRARTMVRDFLLALALLAGCTALFAVTGLDLALERHFYLKNVGWVVGDLAPWRFLYQYGALPAYLVAAAALVLLVAGFFWARAYPYRKTAFFFLLLLALGPGLLVNAVFKDHWGRPRPCQIQLFGGDRPFRQVWQPGTVSDNRSFPSGHASAAFYLIAPYFVWRARARRRAMLALLGGVSYGLLMGFARMAQGGHFPSDILWALGVVYLVGLALYYLLRLDEGALPVQKEPSAP
jgi:lipid A 4'-phosphatase